MIPALEIRDLRFSYPDGSEALRGLDLRVAEGECVGLIGPNGAGKSSLLLHLNGILPEFGGRREPPGSTVRVFGEVVSPANLA